MGDYVVISPAKDEAAFIEKTIASMLSQTCLPRQWVIVDDASVDGTAEIVKEASRKAPFIRLISREKSGQRQPGAGVVRAFNIGYRALDTAHFEYLVKLDCDLSFDPAYFERLFDRFSKEDRLGIASGVYQEVDSEGRWHTVSMPSYHAFGACKVLRHRCFIDIGGFDEAAGWDTVDEIRAWDCGWKTGHFSDLKVQHHRREGSALGGFWTSRMHGRVFYVSGGDPLFFAIKFLRRLLEKPVVIGGLGLLAGYLSAKLRREPLLVSNRAVQTYRRVLRQRLKSSLLQRPTNLDVACNTGRS